MSCFRVSGQALLLTAAVAMCYPNDALALVARDTAVTKSSGSWSVGVFEPLTYAVRDDLELQTHPLLFFVAPNLVVRVEHAELGSLTLAGEYGVSLPTPAMKLAQGYLYPSWEKSDNRIGWFLVPRAGLMASVGTQKSRVITFRADVAYGLQLSRHDANPLGGVAPLDLLFAPVQSGYRARIGTSYDTPLGKRWRARAWANLWLHGEQPSPLTFTSGAGVDARLGMHGRITLGVSYWNADTHAIDPRTHESTRSHDVFPSLDFIWESMS